MEIFIGDRLEEFKFKGKGLINTKGKAAPTETNANQEKGKSNSSSVFKLTLEEEAILLHCFFEENTRSINQQVCLDFESGVDEQALRVSIEQLMTKYDKLRSNFDFYRFSVPARRTFHQVPVTYFKYDYSQLAQDEKEYRIFSLKKKDKRRIFEFIKPPLMRMSLVKTEENQYSFVWTCHEILLLKHSLIELLSELHLIYNAALGRK